MPNQANRALSAECRMRNLLLPANHINKLVCVPGLWLGARAAVAGKSSIHIQTSRLQHSQIGNRETMHNERQ